MIKRFLFILVILGVAVAGPKPRAVAQTAVDLNPGLRSGNYVAKVDNFIVIFDASGSMNEMYKGQAKWKYEKAVVDLLNRTIPDIRIKGALREFSDEGNYNQWTPTDLLYGLTSYSQSGFAEGLNKIQHAEGGSPLALALDAATKDLTGSQGDIAVVIFSDGKSIPRAPVMKSAEQIKNQFGDRVCIYTVLVGNDPGGKELLGEVARTGKCGFFTTADAISGPSAMADFVKKVFLTMGRPDSDGDGVPDYLDKCPNTPRGVKVDSVGCPLDSDGDGVPDYLDKCPNTPRGVKVDSAGCPLDSDGDGVPDYLDKCPGTPAGAKVDARGCWVLHNVHFDVNKAEIKPRYYPTLDGVVLVLKKNPGVRIEIQGYTDNTGTASYNKKLSERRARAIMDYLVSHGISQNRLTAVGYGESRPIASNATSEGRHMNRRVELQPR